MVMTSLPLLFGLSGNCRAEPPAVGRIGPAFGTSLSRQSATIRLTLYCENGNVFWLFYRIEQKPSYIGDGNFLLCRIAKSAPYRWIPWHRPPGQVWQSTGAFRDLLKLHHGRQLEHILYFDLHLCPNISIRKRLIGRYGRNCPAEEPFCSLRRHIEAAMAVRMTIVVVPVGAMEGDAALRDVQHPGYARQVKAIGGNVPGSH